MQLRKKTYFQRSLRLRFQKRSIYLESMYIAQITLGRFWRGSLISKEF